MFTESPLDPPLVSSGAMYTVNATQSDGQQNLVLFIKITI